MRFARPPVALLALAVLATAPAALAGGEDEHGHGGGHGSPLFDSGMLMPGATFELATWKEGTFAYHCHPHPWMEGTFVVGPADGEPVTHAVAIEDGNATDLYRYEPATLSVRLGDTLLWTNNGTLHHTVTADEETVHTHDDHGQDTPAVGLLTAALALAAAALLTVRRRR